MSSYEERRETLIKMVESLVCEDTAVAFSGGVDSSLILKLAGDAAQRTGKKLYAFMLHTMLHPAGEVGDAQKTAAELGAHFQVLEIDELTNAGIDNNPIQRCYLCKKYLFQTVKDEALKYDVHTILEGTNEDDLHVYRPGIQAVKELGIISPLADAGFTKQDVRRLAHELHISVSDKPSTPCLATRFPYGTELTYEAMRKVEEGEARLKALGLYNVRLRVHGEIARIEVDASDMDKLMEHRDVLTVYLKQLGYQYITLDLEGFRSGSMDYVIEI